MTPRTIIVPGKGTQTATYTLPPGLLQYVQSVLVQVDATAAPSVRPTLSIAEQSGVVIATKRPPEPIPAGDTGSVTWALRLTDDQLSASAFAGAIEHFLTPVPYQSVNANAFAVLDWVHQLGANLVDLSVPSAPVIIESGMYACTSYLRCRSGISAANSWQFDMLMDVGGPQPTGTGASGFLTNTVAGAFPVLPATAVRYCEAGSQLYADVFNGAGAARTFELGAHLQRLG